MTTSIGRELIRLCLKAATVVVTVVVLIVVISWLIETKAQISDGQCNVAVLPLEGTILPFNGLLEVPLAITPRSVEEYLTAAEKENDIVAVLIEINSPGGTPVAAERIADRIYNSSLPTVGLIGDVAASGGYMVAAATDHLIASTMSDVGSIGVDMSYLEESKKNEEEGLTYVQLTAGAFKDAGSPNRPLTEEERAKFQKDLDDVHEEFMRLIAKYRGIDIEAVRPLADGSTRIGKNALEVNLIDTLGGRAEATGALASLTGLTPDQIKYCEYSNQPLPFY
ncbi:MAG: signal peptide peptidase SppA [Patescibacteria group bacterium]